MHPKGCIGNEWVKEMFLMTCFIKERFFVVTFSIAAFYMGCLFSGEYISMEKNFFNIHQNYNFFKHIYVDKKGTLSFIDDVQQLVLMKVLKK